MCRHSNVCLSTTNRARLMRTQLLVLLMAFGCSTPARPDTTMTLGDGMIDGTSLKPYRLTWQQCSRQDGVWLNQSEVTEELVIIGENVLRHRQIGTQPGGAVIRSDTFFDRHSFAPLRMEMEARVDGNVVASSVRKLDAKGYTGASVRGESRTALQGGISSKMLHGSVMGLPLATIPYQEDPVDFLASMVAFDGTYVVIAEWVGKEVLDFEDGKIETWMIDVEWRHRESGDVYPPGPDASGGRYWIAPNPPAGYPSVPRYQTDTYAIEFARSVCPTAEP